MMEFSQPKVTCKFGGSLPVLPLEAGNTVMVHGNNVVVYE